MQAVTYMALEQHLDLSEECGDRRGVAKAQLSSAVVVIPKRCSHTTSN
jgi:hypothetical protein